MQNSTVTMEGKQTSIQQFFSTPVRSSPSPTAVQSEYPPVAITPLRPEAAEATMVVVAGVEEEMDLTNMDGSAMLLTLSGGDRGEQGNKDVYEANEGAAATGTPTGTVGDRKKVSNGKKVTFPTHLKKTAVTSRCTPPRTRRSRQPQQAAAPTSPDEEEKQEAKEREIQSLRKDNMVMSKQLAEVTRDLEEMRAWRREMEESTPSCTDLSKRLSKLETICSKALDMKKTVKDLQQETQQVKGRQTELEDAVTAAARRMDKLEEAQATTYASLEARYKESVEADKRLAELEKKAGIEAQPQHESLKAFYLTGLGDLAAAAERHLQRHSDPMVLIRDLLRHLDLEQYMTRIHLINVSTSEAGRTARSAVIFMTSAFHKNEAIIRVKTFLRQKALHRVQAEDCFPPTQLEAVRALRSHGHKLKVNGSIAKYRVVNREGTAVLQTGKNIDDRYEDTPLREEADRRTSEEDVGGQRRNEQGRGGGDGGQPPSVENRARVGAERRRHREYTPPRALRERGQRPPREAEADLSDSRVGAKARERQAPRYRDSDHYRQQQHWQERERKKEEGVHSSSRRKEATPRDLYYAPPRGPVPVEYGGPKPAAARISDKRKAA